MSMFKFYYFYFCFLYIIIYTSDFSLASYNNNNNNNKSLPILCHPEEKFALINFKNSFTIKYSNNNAGEIHKTRTWKTENDCCAWEGIICDPISYHVVGLNLSYSGLTGPIHSNTTLFSLHHLRTLDLSGNDFLPSPISPNFGNFPCLRHLDLYDSNFAGQVPLELAQLSKLHYLDLSYNIDDSGDSLLKMPNSNTILANMTRLRYLHLSWVHLDSQVPPIINMSSLTSLALEGCNLRREVPLELAQLSKLHDLDLSSNRDDSGDSLLKMPNYNTILANMTRLRYLDLSWVHLDSQVPPSIINMSSLTSLALDGCNLRGELFPEILNLPFLKTLAVTSNTGLYSKFPLSNWSSSLDSLWLSDVNFSSKLPSSLTPQAQQLSALMLSNCSLHGPIPSWVWNVADYVQLNFNQLTGNLPSSISTIKPWHLSYLDLGNNLLQGEIPSWLFTLDSLLTFSLASNNFTSLSPNFLQNITTTNLEWLNLYDNKMSENISLDHIFSHLPNLRVLNLSKSGLSVISTNNIEIQSPSIWPNLTLLDLSYCNLTEFRNVLKQGGKETLQYLKLDHNQLSGPLDSSICDLTSLAVLDLSNNAIKSEFPYCLTNISNDLSVLNLGSNNIYGALPTTFPKCKSLQYLDLSNNQLEGMVPKSLVDCKNLQVLNLKRNKLRDEFPFWLGTLPHIKALSLSFNGLHGPITHSKIRNPFSMLQILDLSHNNFSGQITSSFMKSLKAMMEIDGFDGNPQYMETKVHVYYFPITLTIKDVYLHYEKIITSLATIDLSSNKFEGEIPNNIGQLVSIQHLNLSHNLLTGCIPPSISKLTLLESLDLSFNKLTGQVPHELVSLTSLEIFNVSENQLVGPIPQSNNFGSFQEDSYKGNQGLCGSPVLTECGEVGMTGQQSSMEERDDHNYVDVGMMMVEWKVIMMGCGCGTIVGLAWGYYMLSVGKPFWLMKLVHLIELSVADFYWKQFGRRRR